MDYQKNSKALEEIFLLVLMCSAGKVSRTRRVSEISNLVIGVKWNRE